MKPNLKVTFGSDPELHLFDRKLGKIVNAIPILNHDKHNPILLGDGYKAYSDNVLVEAALPPATSKKGIVDSLGTAFKRIQSHLGTRYTLIPKASHVYDDSELGARTPENPAWMSGCSPNLDVYERRENLPANFTDGLRTGSFHIHIGNADWDKDNRSDALMTVDSKEKAIKLLDLFVGVPSVIFDLDESAPARRALYGRAGEFRMTPYGVEYRVLGNFPLRSPGCTELVFDLVDYAMDHVRNGTEDQALQVHDTELIKTAINGSNKVLAKKICSSLPSCLWSRINKNNDADFQKAWGLA